MNIKEYIDSFDGNAANVQDVIDRGVRSKALRENPAFSEAVRDVYWELTLAEDKVMADMTIDGRKAAEESKRCAKMRSLITHVILVLDGKIQEGENAVYEMETTNEQ